MTMYVEIAFPIPLNRTFHYHLPDGLPIESIIGRRVLAPFGKGKSSIGFVVATMTDKPPFETKAITSFLDESPVLTPAMLALTQWVAERTLCSWGDALACAWPTALTAPKRVQPATSNEQRAMSSGKQDSLLQLTSEQSSAVTPILAALDQSSSKPFLVHGVTDSGKTEIYLQAMDRVIAQGRQALYLLPEIAMTPPFLDQLRARYGDEHVGLWHSGLTPNERYRVWTAVQRGDIHVLLGARSAVFAPCPRLGLIVLDEEHEPAYKQDDRPRYHTRDVAVRRAALEGAVLLLGSATPSLESSWQAEQGVYTRLALDNRVNERPLPTIELVDRRPVTTPGVKRAFSLSVFSEPLKLAIEQRLARREQTILFVNRRGFTPFLRCSACGWVARCERCSLTMTVHLRRKEPSERLFPPSAETDMVCHGCARHEKAPVDCPTCKKLKLRLFGVGTQRIEREIEQLFPFAKALRLDRDTGHARHAPEQIVSAFARGEADILVGTQMIAKGFDFPNVTLVGVVDADVSLHLPDFRSSERTFQLICQVAGRAGRGTRPGQVLVQTHYPEHTALLAASHHDYASFYKQEIVQRQGLNYPPFCRLVRVLIRSAKEANALAAAEALVDPLEKAAPQIEILGPAPSPHPRMRSQFRVHLLLKGDDLSLAPALQFLRTWRPRQAFAVVDVDPQDMQ